MTSTRLCATLAVLALVLGAYGRAAAQAPNAAAPAEQAASSAAQAATLSADGELLEVDAKANTITIKTTNTPEMKFKYDTTTKVTGGDKGVAGLATMKGSQVTVQYKRDGATNTATSIMVKSASPAPRTESPRAPEPQPRPEQPPR